MLSSLGQGAGDVLRDLAADSDFLEAREGRELVASLAAQIGRQQRPEDIAALLTAVKSLAQANSSALPIILQRVAARSGTPLAEQIAAATGGKAETLMKSLLAAAAQRAADEAAPIKARIAAVEQLRLATFADQKALLASLLSPAIAADVQSAAVSTLASFDVPDVAEVILAGFAALSPRLKGQATDVLLSRPAWTTALLSALESGMLSTGDLDP
ncbi:MAG: hypothetical protein JF612_12505, partial [Planctomycetia bacterium]|nr:hypothetical protein [Planctomycetia bacterium]